METLYPLKSPIHDGVVIYLIHITIQNYSKIKLLQRDYWLGESEIKKSFKERFPIQLPKSRYFPIQHLLYE